MTFRLAASSYLNSAPLIWSFLYGPHRGSVDFIEAVPARCAQLLAASSVEGALVPVIEYQRIDGGSLVPNVCVGSRTEVLSVVLVSKNNRLENIRSVALDESSRTSVTLVKVIFREFLDHAFGRVKLDWHKYVEIDPRYYRPAEVELLIGDASKAKRKLGWEPKTKFEDLAKLMVDADVELLRRHREGQIAVRG